jgi:hypothetical protein
MEIVKVTVLHEILLHQGFFKNRLPPSLGYPNSAISMIHEEKKTEAKISWHCPFKSLP